MKIYITNLKTSPERRIHIMNELKGKNLDFTFVDCVIGKDLTEKELNEKCDMARINHFNRKVEWFTKGVIGCTLTNQNTYRTLINSGNEMAMLLEDDTFLPHNLKDILDKLEREIQQGDVVLLFYLAHSKLKLKPLQNGETDLYLPLNLDGLHGGSAVVVTRKAAERMLAYNTPIKITPDSWRDFHEAGCIDRLICMYPMPVDTANFDTTMGYVKDNYFRRIMHSSSLTRLLLKLKRKFYKMSKRDVEIVK